MNKIVRGIILSFVMIVFFGSFSYGQELTCEERYFDINFTSQQNFSSINYSGDTIEFTELFTKEFFLVDLSAIGCDDCIEEADEINEDDTFQKYFGMSGSCDFATFVDYGSLSGWVETIGSGTFVADHSYEFTGMNTYYFPQLFNSPVADELPTFLLLGRDAEVVRRYTGELPRYLISDYCLEVDECLEQEEEEGDDDGGDDDGGDDDVGDDDGGDDDGGDDDGGDDDVGDDDGGDDSGSDNGGDGEPGSEPPGGGEPGSGPGGGNGSTPSAGIDPTPINPGNITQDPGRLQIEIPWEAERDVVTNESILTTSNSKDSLRITRRQINRWLWILFGGAILAAILYAGFKFITAGGDPEKSKAALKTFIYIGAAFAIALFAFIIVRLITNLFIT